MAGRPQGQALEDTVFIPALSGTDATSDSAGQIVVHCCGNDRGLGYAWAMKMRARFRRHWKTLVLILVAVLACSLLLRQCRGPTIDVITLQAGPLEQRVVASGRVAAVSRVIVGSQVNGVVQQRLVDEGDRVQPGQLLVLIQADDLAANLEQAQARLATLLQASRPQAQARLSEAQAQLQQAEREAARRSELAREQLVAREDAEQARQAVVSARAAREQAQTALLALSDNGAELAEARAAVSAARAALDKASVRAQVAGTVLTRSVEPGDMVQAGSQLLELASDGPTELHVPVDEKNLQMLALGQDAQAIADAWPQQPFPATLSYIAPSVDSSRGAIEVRLRVEPVPDFLRQDLTVSVNILSARKDDALVIPNTALVSLSGQQHQVWVVEDGRLQPRPVQLGLRGGSASEVSGGLQAGEQVVADARDGLQSGQRVHANSVSINTDPAARTGSAADVD